MLWVLALLVVGALLVAGLTSPARKATQPEPDDDLGYQLDVSPVDAETLARFGTPETVADLVAQGRADELYGLGYRGDLPAGD